MEVITMNNTHTLRTNIIDYIQQHSMHRDISNRDLEIINLTITFLLQNDLININNEVFIKNNNNDTHYVQLELF